MKLQFIIELDSPIRPKIELFVGNFTDDFDYIAVFNKLVSKLIMRQDHDQAVLKSVKYKDGTYSVKIRYNSVLMAVHWKLLKMAKGKILIKPKNLQDLNRLKRNERDAVMHYGNSNVGPNYKPEVILLKGEKDKKLLKHLNDEYGYSSLPIKALVVKRGKRELCRADFKLSSI